MRKGANMVVRAIRGLVRDLRRAGATLTALLAVFLVLGAFIVAVSNMNRILGRWAEDLVITAYLREGVSKADIKNLLTALRQTPEIAEVRYVPPEAAKADLEKGLGREGDLARDLEPDLFPGFFEIRLQGPYLETRTLDHLAGRLEKLGPVEEVVTYRQWYEKLSSLVSLLRTACIIFGLLVVLMTLTVIATTVRLSLLKHSREFEVMKLCGATNRFISTPLVIEGSLLASAAMGTAIGLLYLVLLRFGALSSDLIPLLKVQSFSFLSAYSISLLVLGSAMVGAFGSHLAIRRHLRV